MKYQWLLFDLDNTLLDFDRTAAIAFQKTLSAFQLPNQLGFYERYKKVNHLVWTAYENKKITSKALRPKRFELFLQEIEEERSAIEMSVAYLSFLVESSTLLNGAKELLDFLQKDYQLAVITNGLKEVQRPRLKLTGIEQYFQAIIVSDEIGLAKPQAAFFDYTFGQIQYPPRDKVLVIGDSLNSDIKGGHNSRLDTCWFNPKKVANTSEIVPTYQIKELKELKSFLGS